MKKILVLLICVALLCGCNSEKQGDETTTTASAETTAPIVGIAEEAEEVIAETPEEESKEETGDEDKNGLLTYDLEKAIENDETYKGAEKISFLNPEQQKVFEKAFYIKLMLNLDTSYFWSGIGEKPYENAEMVGGTICMRTGYSYESVMSEFCSVLSEEIVEKDGGSGICNADGEFAISDGARGADIGYDHIEFVPEPTKNDPDVVFKGIATYCDPDSGEVTHTKDYIFRMEKTNNGWKFKEFSLWF